MMTIVFDVVSLSLSIYIYVCVCVCIYMYYSHIFYCSTCMHHHKLLPYPAIALTYIFHSFFYGPLSSNPASDLKRTWLQP